METKKTNFKKAKVTADDYINDATVYVVHGWMLKRLKLKGNAKDIFAIIHGFSQTKNGYFFGSKAYLAKYAGCDVSTVKTVLSSLVEKGLISKYGKEYTGSEQRVYYISNVDPEKLIREEHTLETYIRMKEESENKSKKGRGEITQGENSPSHGEIITESRVENSHNMNNPLDKFKYVAVTDKDIEFKIYYSLLRNSEYLTDLKSNDFSEYAKKTSLVMIEMAKQLKPIEKKIFTNCSDEEIVKIYQDSFQAIQNIFGSFNNPTGYIKQKILDCINSQITKEDKNNDTNDKHK